MMRRGRRHTILPALLANLYWVQEPFTTGTLGIPPLDRSLYAGDAGMLPSKSGLALQMYRKRSTFVAAWRLH